MIKKKSFIVFLIAIITLLSINPVTASATGNFNAAEEVTLSKTYVGTLHTKDDINFYKFTTSKNDSFYKVELRNTEATDTVGLFLYSDSDLTTQIYGLKADQTSVEFDTRKLESNHTYYIVIENYYSFMNATGNYKLTVNEIKDDVADNFNKSKSIPLNKKVVYNLDASNDVDYFKFKTSSNDSYYNIELSNSGASNYVGLYLYEEDDLTTGISSIKANVAESNSIVQKLQPNRTYYLIVKSPYDWYYPIGTYKVNIKEIKDDAPESFKKSKQLSLNKKNTFKINVLGDIDYFKFKPTKSGNYNITFANKDCAGYIDAVLFKEDDVTQSIGLIRSTKASKNTTNFKLKANHTYYIAVNHQSYQYNNAVGEYTLTISYKK